jgi:hypothetical protein
MLHPLAPNINAVLKRETVLFTFTWIWHFCKKVMFHAHENLCARQYILQWVTQFSLRNKVLGPPDSIIDGFLPRCTSPWSTELKCAVWHKCDVFCTLKTWEIGNIPLKY